ncbi:MAG: hypothetical protein HY913_05420 [Desulfomonile tiedjei]|nr:hypothetical protein [Desulfomonile tiedjei]
MKPRKKRRKPKPRNVLVPVMVTHCKGGPHKDKKKESSRNACREQTTPEEESDPGLVV